MTLTDEATVITKPGVYDIPEHEYHADPVPSGSLSSTGARKLLPPSCPAKFRYEQQHPVHKDVFDFGSAAHRLVLGCGADVAVLPFEDWRTKEAKEVRAETRAAGMVPVLKADWARVEDMATAIRQHPVAGKLLDPERGKAEQSLFWQDADTGVWCRARYDFMRDDIPGQQLVIIDYKTAESAEPGNFARSAANFRYHQQDAFYCDGARALGLADYPDFIFVSQDKNAPYLVSICRLSEIAREAGQRLNRRALEVFRDCTESGIWPGYSSEIETVSLPAWAMRLDDE